MIREFLTYLSQRPLLKEARSFGHLSESIALLFREKRCQKSWGPHRTQCKVFISEHLNLAAHQDSVLVLGSGPLHEIPIALLSQSFKRVVLVDIVHLKETKEEVAHLKNVEFIEHDITEVESIVRLKKELLKKSPQAFLNEDWGLVLSVNVMSQLPLHLRSYIDKKLKHKFSAIEIESFLESITLNHLAYLQSFSATALLITDTSTEYCDKKDTVIQTDMNYAHLDLPKHHAEWIWNVAPIPEFQKDVGMKMRVCGFILKNINSH